MIARMPIAWRLAVMFAITAAVVFSGVAVFLYCVLADSVHSQIRSELNFHHSLLDPMIESRQSEADWEVAHRKLDAMTPAGGRVRYWVKSDDPRTAYGRAMLTKDGREVQPGVVTFVKDRDPQKIWSVLSRTIPASGERPEVDFVVALDASSYLYAKENFTHIMSVASGLGILLVALFGYWIAKLGLLPVRRLSRQANALPSNAPRERLGVENLPPEIKELAVSFNNSLARREAAWLQLEGFNADVAHELRTPLTNLIGQTQVSLAHPRRVDELQDLLESNLEELERMSSIVNDMLFLSSAENGNRAAELSDFSVHVEAQKTAEYLEASFAQRAVLLTVTGDAQVHADRRLFHRALANLLSNSARYAREGSEVVVRIADEGAYARVSVSNEGEPIPVQQQARLFERFYRGDAARTRSGVHHGLGLSIVRAIASMHGGAVFVQSAPDGINTFGFTLARGR